MEKKVFRPQIELKENGEKGAFRAVFSTFNVLDHDGDVTLAGAFENGQKVRIAYWGHRWHDLPVGKGVIGSDEEKAWVDGQFFLDTTAGLETYKTVKNLAELQEWSYGFDIEESERGRFEEQDARILKKIVVHEVSPVLLGAGIGTRTEEIKGKKEADSNKDTSVENAGNSGDELDEQIESEAGDPGNESEGARPGRPPKRSDTALEHPEGAQLEDILLNINLNLELED